MFRCIHTLMMTCLVHFDEACAMIMLKTLLVIRPWWWWCIQPDISIDDVDITWTSWSAAEQIDMMSMVCVIVIPLAKDMMTMWLDDLAILKSRFWWIEKIEKCVVAVLLRVMIIWSVVLTNNRTDWRNGWCWCDSEL